jgi:RNA polymerase sigma factor (sigma-70 family)
MNWDEVKKWDYIVDSVALEYHKKFDMVEIQDIKQSLWLWFAEHPNKLKEWEAKGERDAKNLIYRSLRNQAIDYCQRWKAKSVGYDVSDVFYYAPDVVESILPAVLRQEFGVSHKLNLSRVGRPTAPSEGGNLMVIMLEIDYAFWKLSKEDRRILFMRHAESLDFKEIANVLSLGSEDTSRMRHKRAISKLIRRLGGHKPYKDYDLPDSEESTEEDLPLQSEQ